MWVKTTINKEGVNDVNEKQEKVNDVEMLDEVKRYENDVTDKNLRSAPYEKSNFDYSIWDRT